LRKVRSNTEDEPDTGSDMIKGFSGIGVSNVVQRLQLIHGRFFRFDIQSEPDVGTVIIMEFPSK